MGITPVSIQLGASTGPMASHALTLLLARLYAHPQVYVDVGVIVFH